VQGCIVMARSPVNSITGSKSADGDEKHRGTTAASLHTVVEVVDRAGR